MDDDIKTTAEVAEASALKLSGSVHTEPGAPCAETAPLPEAVSKKPIDQKSPAEWAYERLILYIKNFEETLDNDHEAAMGFTDTGGGILKIEGLGYFDPDVVTFYGSDQTGARVQLVQHVSQLNVLLRAMPKAPDAPEPRRIGFKLEKALSEGS
ncbi:MAG: hypothetical protein HKN27_06700 [Silicimonas sp.]|nr:hypothetical protein [Silicimonas sp.]